MSAPSRPSENGQFHLVVFPSDALRRDEPKTRETPIVTALKLQAPLDDGVYATRSELAAALGLSRARVTQLLNVLRLPQSIIDRFVALAEAPPGGVASAPKPCHSRRSSPSAACRVASAEGGDQYGARRT